MTDKTREREAFAKYIAECDELAIVPDAAGAFNWAWQAATARAMAEAVRVCEAERLDDITGTEGDAAYNRAIGHCITAIKEALK